MHLARVNHTLQALFLSVFAVFVLGFSHIPVGQPAMAGMEGMTDHSSSVVQCQILCSTAIKTEEQGLLSVLEDNSKDSLPIAAITGAISLSLLAVAFVVNRLYLLTSWRPPDRILLCGHFADGL